MALQLPLAVPCTAEYPASYCAAAARRTYARFGAGGSYLNLRCARYAGYRVGLDLGTPNCEYWQCR